MDQSSSVLQILLVIILSGILGMVGQAVRVIVGLKQLADQAADPSVTNPDQFSPARLLVSLLIGFVAGVLAAIAMSLQKLPPAASLDPETLLGLIAAGYAGTDFIEGFISRYLPGLRPAAKPDQPTAVGKSGASPQQFPAVLTPPAVDLPPADASACAVFSTKP